MGPVPVTPASVHVTFGLALLLALRLLAPLPAQAQPPEAVPDPRTFGTASVVSHTLQAFTFAQRSTDALSVVTANTFKSRYCTGSNACFLEAPLFLPSGALVTSIQLDACDTSSTAGVFATLKRVGAGESGMSNLATTSTGLAATPGCTLVDANLATPHTIDNVGNSYVMSISLNGTMPVSQTTRLQAVRVFYRLQVSPPGAQVFSDVPPGHPFFQFIQALVAAGITAGCSPSPPRYCPDDLVTRGQMAAFISRALGLHFVP